MFAVRDCNISLKKGDVLGLLGANGAGKTTSFRMMCGIEAPDSDKTTEIFVGGHDLIRNRDKCRQLIGYTAQRNPIWDSLTVFEHLWFNAHVKGVPKPRMQESVDRAISDMVLDDYKHQKAGSLSGGNKRKLVIAMSLLAAPEMVFLDEPSAGMDPEARRGDFRDFDEI